MNSCRRGLRNGVLVNPKLFILEKVNFGQPTKCWSNLVKLNQTWSNALQTCIIWYGSLHFMSTVTSAVGAGCCLFTGVGEWVVSTENGTKSKVEIHEGVK